MDAHFRAFSFVDQITSVQSGTRIRGLYNIPPGIDSFPASLVAESVGQLAAWAIMDAVRFERRPLAGIAGRIDLLAPVQPGQVLELEAGVESIDADAASYQGLACVNGVPVLRLHDCLGPMLPAADYDDPQSLRARFELLTGPGASPGAFEGIPEIRINRTDAVTGQSARATIQVPAESPLFADHFPRQPVLPGTLLMHTNLQLAACLAAEIPCPVHSLRWILRSISNVKLRTFMKPGELLEFEARLDDHADDTLEMTVETRRGKRIVGGARVLFTPETLS